VCVGKIASGHGAKLRLPKARSPSRLGGLGRVVSCTSEIWCETPETEAVLSMPKMGTFWNLVNPRLFNNQTEEIVDYINCLSTRSWIYETTIMLQSHWII